MRVIGIDTAGPVIGVAACDGDRVAERSLRVARGTEAALPALLAEVLDELSIVLQDVDGVAVAIGPGAFTGLRVGLAAAAGLALALEVPVAPIGSLWSRARAAGPGTGPLLSALDARKGRLYAAVFGPDGTEWLPPSDLGVDDVLARLPPGPFRATGEGALVVRPAIERAGGVVVSGAAETGVAALVGEGRRRLLAGEGRDPAELVPAYVRAPDTGA